MLDQQNYPDPKSLKQIEKWDVLKQGVPDLLDLIKENTNWFDWSISIKGKKVIRFEYHTGGWSGNEDVIDALRRNILFFRLFWQKSERGGHHYFRIFTIKERSKEKS